MPDAGLLATIDSQAEILETGVTVGTFEEWSPEIYPGFHWQRVIREVSSNGLFQVDYEIFETPRGMGRGKTAPLSSLSILMYRPLSPSNNPSLNDSMAVPPLREGHRSPLEPTHKSPVQSALLKIEEILISTRFYDANSYYYRFVGNTEETNALPSLVQVTLGIGNPRGHHTSSHEIASRIISWPGHIVQGDLQGIPSLGGPGFPTPPPVVVLTNRMSISPRTDSGLSRPLTPDSGSSSSRFAAESRPSPPKSPLAQSENGDSNHFHEEDNL